MHKSEEQSGPAAAPVIEGCVMPSERQPPEPDVRQRGKQGCVIPAAGCEARMSAYSSVCYSAREMRRGHAKTKLYPLPS